MSVKQQKAFHPRSSLGVYLKWQYYSQKYIIHHRQKKQLTRGHKRINREKPFLLPSYLFLPRTFTNRLLRAFKSNSLHFFYFCSLKVVHAELCRVRGQQWDYWRQLLIKRPSFYSSFTENQWYSTVNMFSTRLPHRLPVFPPPRSLWPHHKKLPQLTRHDFLCTTRNEDKLTSLAELVAHAGAHWPRTVAGLNTAIYRKWTMKVRVSTPWIKISCSENMLLFAIEFNFARHLVWGRVGEGHHCFFVLLL